MHFVLVSGTGYQPSLSDIHLPGMAPVFWQSAGHGLRLPAWYPAEPMAAYLAYVIARQPADLTAHVRRVLLCLERPRRELVSGALMDLFIVLNGRGTALAKRLYALARPHLSVAQEGFFQDWLIRGAVPERPVLDNVHAVLAPPCRGIPLIHPKTPGVRP